MIENSNEEEINKPLDESIIDIPNLETKNKIVMHHPSEIPAAVHHKKNWKSYFWEFFMLFLAVSLGFFTENTRETILQENEVKTQLNSMISDLQSDISLFESVSERCSFSAQMADSLMELLHSDITNTTEIYYTARAVTANVGYYYTNSKSFDQLKAAGLLRYINNKSLLDSIGTYYSSFQWLDNQVALLRMKLDEIHRVNTKVFDSYVFQKMMMNIKIKSATALGGQKTDINKPLEKPTLLSTDLKDINTVSLNYHYYSNTMKFYIRNALALQNRAKALMELVKKEYKLD